MRADDAAHRQRGNCGGIFREGCHQLLHALFVAGVRIIDRVVRVDLLMCVHQLAHQTNRGFAAARFAYAGEHAVLEADDGL